MDNEPTTKVVNGEQLADLVTFRLEGQTFALPIEPIQQIIEMVVVTPLPQMKDTVEGMINFHGDVIPVVNLRSHLEFPKLPLGFHTPIIVVEISGRFLGLIVDEVLDVVNLPTDQILDPKEIILQGLGDTPLLKGLFKVSDKIILLLELEKLFSAVEIDTVKKAAIRMGKQLDQKEKKQDQPKTKPAKSKKKTLSKPEKNDGTVGNISTSPQDSENVK